MTTGDGPDADDEVARLRDQVARLQSELAHGSSPSHPLDRRWRTATAGLLLLVAALLAPVAVVAVWAADEVGDTDRYVENVAPLASDPAVQAAVVERVTAEIFEHVDVSDVTTRAVAALREQGLDRRAATNLEALATPVESAVRSFVEEQVTRVVRSPAFAEAWVAANRAAHDELVAVLTGDGSDAVEVSGGTVRLELRPILETVKQELTDAGFTLAERIPAVSVSFTILESDDVAQAQRGFDALTAAGRWLPVLVIALLSAAVLVADHRRRAVVVAGLAIAAGMVVLGLVLNIARAVYLDAVPPEQLPPDAAAAVYDTLVRFVRFNLRALLVVGLALAGGAWLTGPSPTAVRTRAAISRGAELLRGGAERAGVDTGPVGAWTDRNKTPVRWAVVGLAAVAYLMADHPTGGWTVGLLLITAVALLVVELLARRPAETTGVEHQT